MPGLIDIYLNRLGSFWSEQLLEGVPPSWVPRHAFTGNDRSRTGSANAARIGALTEAISEASS